MSLANVVMSQFVSTSRQIIQPAEKMIINHDILRADTAGRVELLCTDNGVHYNGLSKIQPTKFLVWVNQSTELFSTSPYSSPARSVTP